MLFTLHQYCVLRSIILFGYHFIADMDPRLSDVRIWWMRRDTVLKHCHALRRIGCVTITHMEGEESSFVHPTQEGIRLYNELHMSIVGGCVSFLTSLIMLLVGYFLGLNNA